MKSKHENMEEFLKSELEKEVDEILAEIEADESLQDIALPDDMDAMLFGMIDQYEAEQAAYDMLSNTDKEALRIGREKMLLEVDDTMDQDSEKPEEETKGKTADTEGKVVLYGRKKKKRKTYVLVAAVAVLVVAMGMISIGEVPFLNTIMKPIVGTREMVQIDNTREGEEGGKVEAINEEEKFYREVEEQFSIPIVEMNYRPIGAKFLEGDVDEELDQACLIYEYQGDLLQYQIVLNYNNRSYGQDIQESLIREEIVEIQGIPITLSKYYIKESDREKYVAQFEYKEIYYMISAAVSYDEMEKVLQGLKFY